MGDATEAGKEIGNHWTLLAAVGGTFGAVLMFIKLLMAGIDSRQRENMTLWMNDGGGALLEERVKAAVLSALATHQVTCPHSQRVGSLEERVVSLERGR